jgi:hypothetical protein
MRGRPSDASRKDGPGQPLAPLHKRLGWFALLYVAGVIVVLIVAGIFHVLVMGRL